MVCRVEYLDESYKPASSEYNPKRGSGQIERGIIRIGNDWDFFPIPIYPVLDKALEIINNEISIGVVKLPDETATKINEEKLRQGLNMLSMEYVHQQQTPHYMAQLARVMNNIIIL